MSSDHITNAIIARLTDQSYDDISLCNEVPSQHSYITYITYITYISISRPIVAEADSNPIPVHTQSVLGDDSPSGYPDIQHFWF